VETTKTRPLRVGSGTAWWRTEIRTYLLRLSCAGLNPLLSLVPGLVERKESRLASSLDELVRLRDEFCGEHPARELRVGRDGIRLGVPRDLGDLGGGEGELGAQLPRGVYGGCALEPVGQQELCIVFTDSFGRHGGGLAGRDRKQGIEEDREREGRTELRVFIARAVASLCAAQYSKMGNRTPQVSHAPSRHGRSAPPLASAIVSPLSNLPIDRALRFRRESRTSSCAARVFLSHFDIQNNRTYFWTYFSVLAILARCCASCCSRPRPSIEHSPPWPLPSASYVGEAMANIGARPAQLINSC